MYRQDLLSHIGIFCFTDYSGLFRLPGKQVRSSWSFEIRNKISIFFFLSFFSFISLLSRYHLTNSDSLAFDAGIISFILISPRQLYPRKCSSTVDCSTWLHRQSLGGDGFLVKIGWESRKSRELFVLYEISARCLLAIYSLFSVFRRKQNNNFDWKTWGYKWIIDKLQVGNGDRLPPQAFSTTTDCTSGKGWSARKRRCSKSIRLRINKHDELWTPSCKRLWQQDETVRIDDALLLLFLQTQTAKSRTKSNNTWNWLCQSPAAAAADWK